MIAIKLALRNLLGAGLRTWLNVFVLSFVLVVIVLYNGMLDGWDTQARTDTINWEIGQGEFWHPEYDPYDPFKLQDAHAPVSDSMNKLIQEGKLAPVLITQASIYPQGRMQNIMLKGIEPQQSFLKLPTQLLADTTGGITPAIIGKRLAATANLKKGDAVLVRWRDKNGTFDARELTIAGVFHCDVPSVDDGQIWISLGNLQQMTGMSGEATMFVSNVPFHGKSMEIWQFKDYKFLLKDIDDMMAMENVTSTIINLILLSIALLAVFDTQVLSIFRRQKEIGTYIALGMTRSQVTGIFTVEGTVISVLSVLMACVYGIPFLAYMHKAGIPMPDAIDSSGIAISNAIIPVYNISRVTITILVVVISATLVSYIPARKISKMKPTDAIKGKIQ